MMINSKFLLGVSLFGTIFVPAAAISIESKCSKCVINCDGAVPSKDILWPPNHQFEDITIEGVTGETGEDVTIEITSIYSDEEPSTADGAGGATHVPDASVVGSSTARLRAERSGAEPRNGRVYTIFFQASAGAESCTGTVEVGVPHDKKDIPVNDGADYEVATTGST